MSQQETPSKQVDKEEDTDLTDIEKQQRKKNKRKEQKKKRQERSQSKKQEHNLGKPDAVKKDLQDQTQTTGSILNDRKQQKSPPPKMEELNIPKPKNKKKKKGKKDEKKQEEKEEPIQTPESNVQKQEEKVDKQTQALNEETPALKKTQSKDSKVERKQQKLDDNRSSQSQKPAIVPRKYKPNTKQKLMLLINLVQETQKAKRKNQKKENKKPKVEIIQEEAGSGKSIEEKKEVQCEQSKIQEKIEEKVEIEKKQEPQSENKQEACPEEIDKNKNKEEDKERSEDQETKPLLQSENDSNQVEEKKQDIVYQNSEVKEVLEQLVENIEEKIQAKNDAQICEQKAGEQSIQKIEEVDESKGEQKQPLQVQSTDKGENLVQISSQKVEYSQTIEQKQKIQETPIKQQNEEEKVEREVEVVQKSIEITEKVQKDIETEQSKLILPIDSSSMLKESVDKKEQTQINESIIDKEAEQQIEKEEEEKDKEEVEEQKVEQNREVEELTPLLPVQKEETAQQIAEPKQQNGQKQQNIEETRKDQKIDEQVQEEKEPTKQVEKEKQEEKVQKNEIQQSTKIQKQQNIPDASSSGQVKPTDNGLSSQVVLKEQYQNKPILEEQSKNQENAELEEPEEIVKKQSSSLLISDSQLESFHEQNSNSMQGLDMMEQIKKMEKQIGNAPNSQKKDLSEMIYTPQEKQQQMQPFKNAPEPKKQEISEVRYTPDEKEQEKGSMFYTPSEAPKKQQSEEESASNFKKEETQKVEEQNEPGLKQQEMKDEVQQKEQVFIDIEQKLQSEILLTDEQMANKSSKNIQFEEYITPADEKPAGVQKQKEEIIQKEENEVVVKKEEKKEEEPEKEPQLNTPGEEPIKKEEESVEKQEKKEQSSYNQVTPTDPGEPIKKESSNISDEHIEKEQSDSNLLSVEIKEEINEDKIEDIEEDKKDEEKEQKIESEVVEEEEQQDEQKPENDVVEEQQAKQVEKAEQKDEIVQKPQQQIQQQNIEKEQHEDQQQFSLVISPSKIQQKPKDDINENMIDSVIQPLSKSPSPPNNLDITDEQFPQSNSFVLSESQPLAKQEQNHSELKPSIPQQTSSEISFDQIVRPPEMEKPFVMVQSQIASEQQRFSQSEPKYAFEKNVELTSSAFVEVPRESGEDEQKNENIEEKKVNPIAKEIHKAESIIVMESNEDNIRSQVIEENVKEEEEAEEKEIQEKKQSQKKIQEAPISEEQIANKVQEQEVSEKVEENVPEKLEENIPEEENSNEQKPKQQQKEQIEEKQQANLENQPQKVEQQAKEYVKLNIKQTKEEKPEQNINEEQPQPKQQQNYEQEKPEEIPSVDQVKKRNTLIDSLIDLAQDDLPPRNQGTSCSITPESSKSQHEKQQFSNQKKSHLSVQTPVKKQEKQQEHHEHSPYPYEVRKSIYRTSKEHNDITQQIKLSEELKPVQEAKKLEEIKGSDRSKSSDKSELVSSKKSTSPFAKESEGGSSKKIMIVEAEPVRTVKSINHFNMQSKATVRYQQHMPRQFIKEDKVPTHVHVPISNVEVIEKNQPSELASIQASSPHIQPVQVATEITPVAVEVKKYEKKVVEIPSISRPLKMLSQTSPKRAKTNEDVKIFDKPIQRGKRLEKYSFPTTSCQPLQTQIFEKQAIDQNVQHFLEQLQHLRRIPQKPKKEITINLSKMSSPKASPKEEHIHPAIKTPTFSFNQQQAEAKGGNNSPTRINFVRNVELTTSVFQQQNIPKPEVVHVQPVRKNVGPVQRPFFPKDVVYHESQVKQVQTQIKQQPIFKEIIRKQQNVKQISHKEPAHKQIKFKQPTTHQQIKFQQPLHNQIKYQPPIEKQIRKQTRQINQKKFIPNPKTINSPPLPQHIQPHLHHQKSSPIAPKIQIKYKKDIYSSKSHQKYDQRQITHHQGKKMIVEKPMKSPYKTKLSVYSPKDIKIVQVHLDEKYLDKEKKDPIRLHSKKKRYQHSLSPFRNVERSVQDKVEKYQYHQLHGSLEKDKPRIQSISYRPLQHEKKQQQYKTESPSLNQNQNASPVRKNKLTLHTYTTKTPEEQRNQHKIHTLHHNPIHHHQPHPHSFAHEEPQKVQIKNLANTHIANLNNSREKPFFNRQKIKITLKNSQAKKVVKNLEDLPDEVKMNECFPFFDPSKNIQKL